MYNVSFTGPLGTATLVGDKYAYDKANRLDSAYFGYYLNSDSSFNPTTAYNGIYTYDSVGNFRKLKRYGNTAGTVQDSLTYAYRPSTNQDTLITGSSSSYYYTYDANGNVTSDTHWSIALIIYDPNNTRSGVFNQPHRGRWYSAYI
jgi:hypothetical protein